MKKKPLTYVLIIALVLAVSAGMAGFLVCTRSGARFVLDRFLTRYVGPGGFDYGKFGGNLWQGVAIKNLEFRDIPGIAWARQVRVQDLSARLVSLGILGLDVSFRNARLLSLRDEPIVAEGHLRQGRILANVYARTFDLLRIKEFFPAFRHLSLVKGSLKDVDLLVSGEIGDIRVRGRSVVEKWRYATYSLENCVLTKDLHFLRLGGRWQVYGKVSVASGDFLTPRVKIKLGPSHLEFEGSPERPRLDITGQTRVQRVTIDLVIRGTRENPQVVLSSDAGLSQEQLLLMLTTGKRWKSVDGSALPDKMTPAVAADFVDYLIFGGSGKTLSQYLGLSGFSVNFDENKRGLSVSKDVTDRFGVGYDVEVQTPQNEPVTMKQKVTGEYDVTDRMTVGVQKEMTGPSDSGLRGQGRERPADDRIYMKYKAKF